MYFFPQIHNYITQLRKMCHLARIIQLILFHLQLEVCDTVCSLYFVLGSRVELS